MTAKLKVHFRLTCGTVRVATGREAETLAALVRAGPRGLSSLDAFRAGWAVRLAAYVHDLKRLGVPIVASRESHDGGSHARYRLSGHIEIVQRSGETGRATP